MNRSLLLLLVACNHPDLEGVDLPPHKGAGWSMNDSVYRTADGLFELYFTLPGTQQGEEEDPPLDDAVIALIDGAQGSIDASLYEFGRAGIIDAFVRAKDRGVQIRFAGDGDELHDPGYVALEDAGVRLSLRPARDRIMHNKFIVVDERFVWTGSTNMSENGVMFNNNGSVLIDSPTLAAEYKAELDQMYEGELFGRKKSQLDPSETFQLGEHAVDLHYSPGNPEQAMLAALDQAQHSVFFMIFSFTREDISSKLIALHNSGVQVVGIFDESQALGRYSVDETLALAGVPVYIDGNENSYGFSGGKLHHKTMIIDPLTQSDPTVTVGSYNWSASASDYNDENLLILEGPELPSAYFDQFCSLLAVATPHPDYAGELPDPCSALLQQVRINEFVPNPDGTDTGHEWVEIVNTGQAPVDLDGWMLGDATREDRHTFIAQTLAPGEAVVVFDGPDNVAPGMVVASTGYLGLANNADEIVLRDKLGSVVDRVAYTAAGSGVSFNRVPDGGLDGHFVVSTPTPGTRADGAPWGGQVILNEVMSDPVDEANGEWIELINVGTAAVDITGWQLFDTTSSEVRRHTFASTVLSAGESLVVESGAALGIPNAVVASTGALGLNNAGDGVRLRDATGALMDEVAFGAATQAVSWNRAIDGDPDSGMVLHTTLLEGTAANASPGGQATGSTWGAQLFINELMPDPAGSDAEGEWVEIVNGSPFPVDLQGWSLGDATNPARHVFGNVSLPAGEALLVYSGGEHTHVASSGTLSLNNSGDLVSLHDDTGKEQDAVTYQATREGISLNRATDGDSDAPLADHDSLPSGTPSSPGTRADGSTWP